MMSNALHTVSLHPKIANHHLSRTAFVYIRQSSQGQVLWNKESQVNQYQLVEHAQQLGWDRERTRIIDVDLGLSGKESASRSGFQELVAEVSLGHSRIVFGYEVSRLARNNSDGIIYWTLQPFLIPLLRTMMGFMIQDNTTIDCYWDSRAP